MEVFEKFQAPNCNCQVRRNIPEINVDSFLFFAPLVRNLIRFIEKDPKLILFCFLKELFVKKMNESQ